MNRKTLYAVVFSMQLAGASGFQPPDAVSLHLSRTRTGHLQAVHETSQSASDTCRIEAEISRRVALVTAAATAVATFPFPVASVDLESFVRRLEITNMFNRNSNGAPDKHLPQVSLADDSKTIRVVVNHVMETPHFILLIWLHNVKTNEIAVVKGFPADSPGPPTLRVQIPAGVVLQPMAYCNLHGLWEGDKFLLTNGGQLEFTA